jgi:glucan-binding YG repeat protein
MKKLAAFMILLMSFFYFTSHTEASASQLIIINKKTNTLAFYDGGALVKTFKVATGRNSTYTPEGTFKIVNKIKNRPYYTNNIPGGDPRNPLGDRWMGLDARGTYGTTYAIHGNSNENSIGKYASSGCVRMHNQEVRWLFDQVQVNTTVIITSSDSSSDAIAAANGYTVSVSASADSTDYTPINLNGWVQNGSNKYYYTNGTVKKGWQTIEGKRYFFDDSGAMKTGWLEDQGKKYYLDSAGVMKTGWVEENGLKYYFDPAGEMRTGWVDDGGKRYYLDHAGVMKIGWFNEADKRYYLDNTGAMKIGWLDNGGKRYYFDPAGAMKKDWIEDAGKWHYLDSTGIMKTGWINYKGKWYYINTNGTLDSTTASVPNFDISNTDTSNRLWEKYLQNNSGNLVTSWLKYENKWYYLYVGKDMAENSLIDKKTAVNLSS